MEELELFAEFLSKKIAITEILEDDKQFCEGYKAGLVQAKLWIEDRIALINDVAGAEKEITLNKE